MSHQSHRLLSFLSLFCLSFAALYGRLYRLSLQRYRCFRGGAPTVDEVDGTETRTGGSSLGAEAEAVPGLGEGMGALEGPPGWSRGLDGGGGGGGGVGGGGGSSVTPAGLVEFEEPGVLDALVPDADAAPAVDVTDAAPAVDVTDAAPAVEGLASSGPGGVSQRRGRKHGRPSVLPEEGEESTKRARPTVYSTPRTLCAAVLTVAIFLAVLPSAVGQPSQLGLVFRIKWPKVHCHCGHTVGCDEDQVAMRTLPLCATMKYCEEVRAGCHCGPGGRPHLIPFTPCVWSSPCAGHL